MGRLTQNAWRSGMTACWIAMAMSLFALRSAVHRPIHAQAVPG